EVQHHARGRAWTIAFANRIGQAVAVDVAERVDVDPRREDLYDGRIERAVATIAVVVEIGTGRDRHEQVDVSIAIQVAGPHALRGLANGQVDPRAEPAEAVARIDLQHALVETDDREIQMSVAVEIRELSRKSPSRAGI